jgi:hypothetical protein
MQCLYVIAYGSEHPPHLVIAAFVQRETCFAGFQYVQLGG